MSAHREALSRASDLQRQGDAGGALKYCREALELAPDDAETNAMLGNLLAVQGSFDEAEKHFAIAATAEPGIADYANLLGECRGRLGRLDEAIVAFEEALRRAPDDHRARCNLAIAHASSGDFSRAEPEFEAALALQPDDNALAQQLAAIYARLGKFGEADRLLRKILARNPRNLPALFNLSANLLNQGQSAEAIRHLQTALDIEPDYLIARLALARALHAEHRLEEALEEIEQCAATQADSVPVLVEKAAILFARMEIDKAGEVYRQIIRLDPATLEGRCGLAEIALYCQRPADAIAQLEKTGDLRQDPRQLALYAKACRLAGRGQDPADLLDQVLAQPALTGRARKSLLLERGFLFDRDDNADAAMAAWTSANKCVPNRFDQDSHERLVRRTIEQCRDLPDSGLDDERPVLIIGMPRSGKSIVEQMLCSHPDVYGAGETSFLAGAANAIASVSGNDAYPEGASDIAADALRELADSYLSRLCREAGQRRRVTESLSLNFLYIGALRQLVPRARIIHCQRDPGDLYLACLQKNFLDPDLDFSDSLDRIARYHRSYRELVAFWRAHSGLDWIDVRYEAIVGSTEATLRDLAEFLGLDWDREMSNYYLPGVPNTLRRDLIHSPVDDREIGMSSGYAKWLAPLLEEVDR